MKLKEKLHRFLDSEFEKALELSFSDDAESVQERILFYPKVLDGVEQILNSDREEIDKFSQ